MQTTAPADSRSASKVRTHRPVRSLGKTRQYLLLPALGVIVVFFVFPILAIIWKSFSEPELGFDNYISLINDGVTVTVLNRTLVTAVLVSAVTLLCAYPYAYAMTRVSPGVRKLMILIVLVPFWTSLMARTFAWYVLEQQGGLIHMFFSLFGLDVVLLGTISGVALAMIQVMLPFMVLPLYSGMSGIDHRLVDAASTLGAKPVSVFRDVYFPLSLPAIVSGTSLVFIITLGFYVTPALLGAPNQAMLSQIIAIRVNELLDFSGAGALGLVLFVVTLAVVLILSKLGGLTSVAGSKVKADD